MKLINFWIEPFIFLLILKLVQLLINTFLNEPKSILENNIIDTVDIAKDPQDFKFSTTLGAEKILKLGKMS